MQFHLKTPQFPKVCTKNQQFCLVRPPRALHLLSAESSCTVQAPGNSGRCSSLAGARLHMLHWAALQAKQLLWARANNWSYKRKRNEVVQAGRN